MKNMLLSKLKMATAVMLALGVLTWGTVALSYRAFAVKQQQTNKKVGTSSGVGRTPMVEVWQERAVLKDHGDLVYSVAFAPNGKLFATAGADGTVKLWETATRRVKATLQGDESRVYSVAFSPRCWTSRRPPPPRVAGRDRLRPERPKRTKRGIAGNKRRCVRC
jgi:WD40 repeat protein